MGRKPNNASSVYQGADGYWHGRVTVGVKDDGKPDRRHVMSKTEAAVTKKVRDLERERDTGTVRKAGQRWTVKDWLAHWVEEIAAPTVRDNTISGYRVAVYHHLIPGVGAHQLHRLEPEHLERFYRKMQETGSAPATAHQAHRTIRTALNEAMRRNHVSRNVASLAKAPRLGDDAEIEPYSIEDVRRLLQAAGGRRNSARWAIALALGLRQGEALGLKWSDLDLEAGTLTVRRGRQRPRWRHGCAEPCGRKFGGHCPERVALRAETADTKSRAGRRRVGLPDPLVALLRKHKDEQDAERETAGQLWTHGGWLFTTPTGGPVNPRTDYSEWKRLLKAAKLRDGRLHDARHTAATVLLILGVSERAVMGIMGWSNSAMATRYQHITAQVQQDVAQQVGGLLWGQPQAAEKAAPPLRGRAARKRRRKGN
ncbi:MAG TPA: site-specific integrase [Pilimelia sp.]|nr:site-specific integrase [Pilimelia sp.]